MTNHLSQTGILTWTVPLLSRVVRENSLILQPKSESGKNSFTVEKLTVPNTDLARWNVCPLGALTKISSLEALTCTSLILKPLDDGAGSIEHNILQLQLEHVEADLTALGIQDLIRRGHWTIGLPRKSSGTPRSSSSSAAVPRIPMLPAFELLAEIFERGNIAELSEQASREVTRELRS